MIIRTTKIPRKTRDPITSPRNGCSGKEGISGLSLLSASRVRKPYRARSVEDSRILQVRCFLFNTPVQSLFRVRLLLLWWKWLDAEQGLWINRHFHVVVVRKADWAAVFERLRHHIVTHRALFLHNGCHLSDWPGKRKHIKKSFHVHREFDTSYELNST